VVRPGARSAHVRYGGRFAWPAQRDEALSALEGLIQEYADQWMQPRSLWGAPAEALLSDEVI
jgi:hypothetical protein